MTSQKLVYLDHSSTAWPKASAVGPAMQEALDCAGSPSRAAHQGARDADRLLRAARRSAAEYFHINDTRNLIFVPGATFGLNFVIQGLLAPNSRVAVFSGEHNAVTRPLGELSRRGQIKLRWIASDPQGVIDLEDAWSAVCQARTRLVICQQASNVSGALQPLTVLASIAHSYGALVVVDGAQAAGHLPINVEDLGADAWVCSGHKGLRGPAGSGLVWLSPEINPRALVSGGTGGGEKFSDNADFDRPGCYETGTAALPAWYGLGAAIEELDAAGSAPYEAERRLITHLIQGLEALDIPTLHLVGPLDPARRVPLISCYDERIESERLAFELDRRYNIAVRAGRHCAPALYDALGLPDTGTLRFGVGPQNTIEELDYALNALGELLRGAQ